MREHVAFLKATHQLDESLAVEDEGEWGGGGSGGMVNIQQTQMSDARETREPCMSCVEDQTKGARLINTV